MNATGVVRKHPLPALTALAVFLLILVRAWVQSITIDEADTYLAWVASADARHWWPAANNHVLNSMLMRLFVTVFGPSELTLRIPALIGSAIYLLACYRICILLAERTAIRVIVILCLTANPFVLDYLVAARGYSLALGFLVAAVAVAAGTGWTDARFDERRVRRTCGVSSLLLGLSFASNFSFAVVDGFTMVAISIWMSIQPRKDAAGATSGWKRNGALVLWSVVPGLIVFLFLCSSVVLDWPKGQLVFGAKSVAQMWSGIFGASMYRVNPHLVNPLIHPVIDSLRVVLLPVIGILFGVQAVLLGIGFRRLPQVSRRRLTLGVLVSGVILSTFLVHWIAFRAFGILLPEKRTALYYAAFIVLLIAIVGSVRAPSKFGRIAGGALTVSLAVLAGYFLSCLRLTYFQEWFWNSDSRHLYTVVAQYARKLGARDIESHWKWVASLNYYRSASGEDAFNEVIGPENYSKDKKLYVLDFPVAQEFIREQQLEVVYHGEESEVAVAIRPEVKPATPAVPVTATIRNLTRPRATDFHAGERFEVTVNGPAGQPVYLSARQGSKPESASRFGQTDRRGRFALQGQMGDEHVGEWREIWSVGGRPAPVTRFMVKPRRGSAAQAAE